MTPGPFPHKQKAQESETWGSVEERPHCMRYEEKGEGGGREGGTPVLELRLTLEGKVNMALAERPL